MAGQQLTYEELVDHIINDKPVPNILAVPNITQDPSLITKSSLRPRAKPWEQKKEVTVTIEGASDEAQAIDREAGAVSHSHSTESLSTYYAMETEFEQQMQLSLIHI